MDGNYSITPNIFIMFNGSALLQQMVSAAGCFFSPWMFLYFFFIFLKSTHFLLSASATFAKKIFFVFIPCNGT